MQDHNLDDLIIEEKPEKGKGKGILAIIVLLIAILIIALIMTRIFLDNSDGNSTVVTEEKQADLISPELQLDSSDHDLEADKKELDQLSSILEDELTNKVPTDEKKQTNEMIKPDTMQIDEAKEPSKPTIDIQVSSPAKKQAIAPVKQKPIKREPIKQQPVKQKPVVNKIAPQKPQHVITAQPVVHKRPKSHQKSSGSTGNYYIQVGAFTKQPSSRFLSIITSSGFRYKLSNGKLLIGPYSNRNSAKRDLPRVKDKINKGAFIKKL